MKELKLPKPEQATTDQITNDSFIGVEFHSLSGENKKGIVIKNDAGRYTVVTNKLDISGNWTASSKRDYAKTAIEMGDKDYRNKVFMFEYLSEMIAWWNR